MQAHEPEEWRLSTGGVDHGVPSSTVDRPDEPVAERGDEPDEDVFSVVVEGDGPGFDVDRADCQDEDVFSFSVSTPQDGSTVPGADLDAVVGADAIAALEDVATTPPPTSPPPPPTTTSTPPPPPASSPGDAGRDETLDDHLAWALQKAQESIDEASPDQTDGPSAPAAHAIELPPLRPVAPATPRYEDEDDGAVWVAGTDDDVDAIAADGRDTDWWGADGTGDSDDPGDDPDVAGPEVDIAPADPDEVTADAETDDGAIATERTGDHPLGGLLDDGDAPAWDELVAESESGARSAWEDVGDDQPMDEYAWANLASLGGSEVDEASWTSLETELQGDPVDEAAWDEANDGWLDSVSPGMAAAMGDPADEDPDDDPVAEADGQLTADPRGGDDAAQHDVVHAVEQDERDDDVALHEPDGEPDVTALSEHDEAHGAETDVRVEAADDALVAALDVHDEVGTADEVSGADDGPAAVPSTAVDQSIVDGQDEDAVGTEDVWALPPAHDDANDDEDDDEDDDIDDGPTIASAWTLTDDDATGAGWLDGDASPEPGWGDDTVASDDVPTHDGEDVAHAAPDVAADEPGATPTMADLAVSTLAQWQAAEEAGEAEDDLVHGLDEDELVFSFSVTDDRDEDDEDDDEDDDEATATDDPALAPAAPAIADVPVAQPDVQSGGEDAERLSDDDFEALLDATAAPAALDAVVDGGGSPSGGTGAPPAAPEDLGFDDLGLDDLDGFDWDLEDGAHGAAGPDEPAPRADDDRPTDMDGDGRDGDHDQLVEAAIAGPVDLTSFTVGSGKRRRRRFGRG